MADGHLSAEQCVEESKGPLFCWGGRQSGYRNADLFDKRGVGLQTRARHYNGRADGGVVALRRFFRNAAINSRWPRTRTGEIRRRNLRGGSTDRSGKRPRFAW